MPPVRTRSPRRPRGVSMGNSVLLAEIRDEEIVSAEVEALVRAASVGATVCFTGLVRDHDRDLPGETVTSLEYSCHPSAPEFMAQVCGEIAEKYGVRVAAAHRVGTLAVGDVAVAAAVSSAHRGDSFEACRELIDRIKSEVPIWKRQYGAAGSAEWVRGTCAH